MLKENGLTGIITQINGMKNHWKTITSESDSCIFL